MAHPPASLFTALELVDLAALAKQLTEGDCADEFLAVVTTGVDALRAGDLSVDAFRDELLTAAQNWMAHTAELTAGMVALRIQMAATREPLSVPRPVMITGRGTDL